MDKEIKKNPNQPIPVSSGYSWIEKLPVAVWDWLVSSELTYSIINLNRRLGFDGVKIAVIPDLIMQLALKELPPEKLASSLAKELGLDSAKAAAMAKEIEEKMLHPIEVPLRNELGIDIKKIYASIQSNQLAIPVYRPTSPVTPSSPSLPKPPPPAGGPPTPKEIPVKINVQPVRQAQGEPIQPNQPFGSDSWVNKIK